MLSISKLLIQYNTDDLSGGIFVCVSQLVPVSMCVCLCVFLCMCLCLLL